MNTTFLILAGLPIIVGGGILFLFLALSRLFPGMEKKATAEAVAVTVPARGPEYVQLTGKRTVAYRRGLSVLLGLSVLTALEFAVAQATGSLVPMFIIALAKAALILYFFMHLYTVWSEEAH